MVTVIPRPKIIVIKRQRESLRLIGLMAMQERIRRQISIEWWLVYFCIIPRQYTSGLLTKGPHPPTPRKVHAFLICCWSRIHSGLNPSMKLTENANESPQQLSLQHAFFSLSFFFQFCIQAADVSEFSFLFLFSALANGEQRQTLATFGSHAGVFARPVCISSLHRRWPHKACSSKSEPFFGCTSHSEGV